MTTEKEKLTYCKTQLTQLKNDLTPLADYTAKLGRWERKEGEFAKFKNYSDETKFVSQGTCWTKPRNQGDADWQCGHQAESKAFASYDPWGWKARLGNDPSGADDPCKTLTSFWCMRTTESVAKAKQDYEAAKPQPPVSIMTPRIVCCPAIGVAGTAIPHADAQSKLFQVNLCNDDIETSLATGAAYVAPVLPGGAQAPSGTTSGTKGPTATSPPTAAKKTDYTWVFVGVGSCVCIIFLIIIILIATMSK